MCGKGSSGGGGGLAPAQQVTVSPSPQAMEWYNSVMARGQQAASRPFQQYGTTPEAFVAQLNPQQQQAIYGLGGLAAANAPYAALAPQMAAQAGMGNAAQMVGGYMNPFMQQVIDPVRQALQQQQGQQLSQQQAEAIRAGAFGGDRAGLQRAQLMGQQQLAMGNALSPLYQTGYGQALQAAQTDLARQLQAAQGIGAQGQQAAQAALGAATLGQQTEQAGKTALYNQFQQQQMFPYMQAQFLGGLAGALGPLTGSTTVQSQAQSPFGMFLSDPRAKTGVTRSEPDEVGRLHDGQKVYAYRYADGGPAQIGLMADEVASMHPDAVGVRPDGLMAVDYGKATEDAARMGGAVRNGGDYSRGGYADGGLTSSDIAAILAAQQAMYGSMKPAAATIPTEGIRTSAPLSAASMSPGERPKSGLETMEAALGVGEKLSDFLSKGYDIASGFGDEAGKTYSAYQRGSILPKSFSGRAYGGGVAPDDQSSNLWDFLSRGIQSARPLEASKISSGGDSDYQKGGLDTAADYLGTAGKIGSGIAGLASAAKVIGPALMALSDPRAKTGVRPAAQAGGVYSDEDVDYYLRPLAKGETGGEKDPYRAIGPQTKYGQALGKYQILEGNIAPWARTAGLGNVTREQFLGDPDLQERIARSQFGSYLRKTGTPAEAAAMWFAGPGYKSKMGAKDVLGTSVPEYMARYERNLEKGGVGPALSSLGPRERSFMATTTPQAPTGVMPPAAGGKADEAPRGLADMLTDKQVMVPLLTGLGTGLTTMVGTPSRYLGSALLAGAGAGMAAGAKSYMDVAKQIPEIREITAKAATQEQETKAKEKLVERMGFENIEEMMKVYKDAFFTTQAGVPMVRLADGTVTTEADFRRNPRPVFGQSEATLPQRPGAKPTGKQGPLMPGAGAVQPPPGIGWDSRSMAAARGEMDAVTGGTTGARAAAEARSADYRNTVDRAAEAAQAQKLLVNDVGGIISEAAHATGMNAPGAGGSTRAMVVNYGNTIARMYGLGENYFGASDTNAALLGKLNTLAGQRGVEAAQQTALGSLARLVEAQPNLDQPPKASVFNAASNMVNNQMKLDQRDHADTYAQASGGFYSRAGVDFKRVNTPLKYRKEQEAIMKAMWEDPEGFKAMLSGTVDPSHIEQYFRDPKHGGIVGMSRYFGG